MERREFLTTCNTMAVAGAIGVTPLSAHDCSVDPCPSWRPNSILYEVLLTMGPDGKSPGWVPIFAEHIKPNHIIRDRKGANPSQMYEVLDGAKAWDLMPLGDLVLLPMGRDGKTIICKEIRSGIRSGK